MIFLNLVLARLRLGLKNYQVGEKWILDDYLLFMQRSRYLISTQISAPDC
ncbi:hypothetical protein THERMOS_1606 [Bathymodiolus thermophilus thioautotrophic gill symbiont]|uniref:Uncharacterized protein n=1 Tax=Bathymodiolus thermophilus thioautotrophic gill symbiont TaxID=2360 RepID=A0A8H8XEB0_9GAMM|nr:hypothetical protein THERMOS_1606 [Bathymodiolus thermophilus thioautotrophic gill symbiont]